MEKKLMEIIEGPGLYRMMNQRYSITSLERIHVPAGPTTDEHMDCEAVLLCDACKERSVRVKFTMAPPGYKSQGVFHGHNLDLCIWYGGQFSVPYWYRDSDMRNWCVHCGAMKLLMELASGSVSDGYFLPWTKLHEKLAILES